MASSSIKSEFMTRVVTKSCNATNLTTFSLPSFQNNLYFPVTSSSNNVAVYHGFLCHIVLYNIGFVDLFSLKLKLLSLKKQCWESTLKQHLKQQVTSFKLIL